MGNDGGSIPKRRELVKEAARNPTTSQLKETTKEQLAHRWSTCPLSHRPLTSPIVSDCDGNLYNKDAIIHYLLPTNDDKSEADNFLQGRIKSLRDIVEVRFELDPSGKGEKWICPISLKPLGPALKAVYLVPCGHAFSLEATKEMPEDDCAVCGSGEEKQTREPKDVVPILPMTEEEREVCAKRIGALKDQGLSHSLKKVSGAGKKRKVGADSVKTVERGQVHRDGHGMTTVANGLHDDTIAQSSTPQSGTSVPKHPNRIQNAVTASLTAKVLEEEQGRAKRKKLMGENQNLQSLFSQGRSDQKGRDGDFMTRGFSISAHGRHQ